MMEQSVFLPYFTLCFFPYILPFVYFVLTKYQPWEKIESTQFYDSTSC